MSLKHGLLGLLNYGEMTGYELDKAFKVSLNFFWQAQTSQIYRELTTMEKQGWLNSKIIPQVGKPNQKRYWLTDSGRLELNRWLDQDETEEALNVKNAFLMKLFFSANRPIADTVESLKTYQAQCEKTLLGLRQSGSVIQDYGSDLQDKRNMSYWGATASFGLSYLMMCSKWAEETINNLEAIS